jgi:hypothetical protein
MIRSLTRAGLPFFQQTGGGHGRFMSGSKAADVSQRPPAGSAVLGQGLPSSWQRWRHVSRLTRFVADIPLLEMPAEYTDTYGIGGPNRVQANVG